MQRGEGRRKLIAKRVWVGSLTGCLLLGCGAEPERTRWAEVGDEVEWDGWVDSAHALVGDGATSFESFARQGEVSESAGPSRPYFLENEADAGPLTSMVGDHLLSLSRFRGLVSTRVTGPDAPHVEGSVPLTGLPVGLVVSEGVAAVLLVDPQQPECFLGDCVLAQSSRVVLIDVQDPASPQALGEQRFEGTLAAARQVGGVLHVLSRQLDSCLLCEHSGPNTDFTWLAFDRRAPRELPSPRVTRVGGYAFFGDQRLLVLSPGAFGDAQAPELRVAELAEPQPALSAPVALGGRVRQALVSGDRLRVTYEGPELDLETFALGAGTALPLGRSQLTPPDGDSFGWLSVEGNRALTLLEPSGRLAVFDLSDPNLPRVASLPGLELAETKLLLAGERALVVGRSTRAADRPLEDVSAHGPQALVLVDIADATAPGVLDRVTLGSFDSVPAGLLELRGTRALFSYYDEFPGAGTPLERGDCGRAHQRLMGYDLASGRLAPAFAFDGVDADARVEAVADDFWIASSLSVSRYLGGSGTAPSARVELTRSVDHVRALSGSLALFGVDFASNAPTLDLAPSLRPLESLQARDVSAAAGLARVGCDERRRWYAPALERAGSLYALRFHLPLDGAGAPATATLHVLDAFSPSVPPARARSLELEPLAAGEDYLGAVQTESALLIARGRRDAEPTQPGYDPRSLDRQYGRVDPTAFLGQGVHDPLGYDLGDTLRPDAQLSYDVIDLSDPAAPVLASRLDIDPALATAGFFRSVRGVTRDTTWGFDVDTAAAGPAIVSGSILVGQHSEALRSGRQRFYLDRFDFSAPATPVQLPAIEIPGSVLDFDAATGALVTLEALRFPQPEPSARCSGSAPLSNACSLQRRALNGLVVDDARATRVGRLVVDTDEHQAVRFAVANGRVYYVTLSSTHSGAAGGPFADRELTLERVVLRDGSFERLPSFDVSSSSRLTPLLWEHFVARGERALWVAGGQLMVADFAGEEPRLEVHELGPWGCTALDLQGDTVYCAQGQAGLLKVALGEP